MSKFTDEIRMYISAPKEIGILIHLERLGAKLPTHSFEMANNPAFRFTRLMAEELNVWNMGWWQI